MFDKMAYTMRMFISEDQHGGFYQKMSFCDAPDHCHTFHSIPIVNYTENEPLPARSVGGVDMFDKRADRFDDHNDGFYFK